MNKSSKRNLYRPFASLRAAFFIAVFFVAAHSSFSCPLNSPTYGSIAVTCNSFTVSGINSTGSPSPTLYEIKYSEHADLSSAPSPASTFGSNVTVSGLDVGKRYYFILRSYNSTCLYSNWSDTFDVKLDSNLIVSAASITCNSAVLSWPSWGANITNYSIKNVNTGVTTSKSVASNPEFAGVVGLSPSTFYTFEVTVNSSVSGCNLKSTVGFTTAPVISPPVMTGMTGTDIKCASFQANWNTVSGATGYFLEVSADPAYGSYVSGYNWLYVPYGHTTSITVSGLSPTTTYYYRVHSANECISVASSSVAVTTIAPLTPPDTTGKRGTNVTCSSFRANWNTVAGASGYYLEVYSAAGYHPSYNWLYVADGSSNFADVYIDIDPSTAYYYSIRAANDCISGPSLYTQVNTPACKTKTTGVKENHVLASKISFMPNPTSNNALFSCETKEVLTYELIDIQGRLLQTSTIKNGDAINMGAYSNGIYLVRVLDAQGMFISTTRLLKN